eukprot:jgi/Hompol1/2497/HPOL_005618-RA
MSILSIGSPDSRHLLLKSHKNSENRFSLKSVHSVQSNASASLGQKKPNALWDAVFAATHGEDRNERDLKTLRNDLKALKLADQPGIHLRELSHTIAVFGHRSDAALFDNVAEWFNKNPTSNSIDCLDLFGDQPHIDCITKIFYSKAGSLWDAIIQYSIGEHDHTKKLGDKVINEIRHEHLKALIAYKDYMNDIHQPTLSSAGVILFSVLQSVFVDPMYSYIARKLNDFENYRTLSEHEDNLIIKGFILSFINNFAIVFHLAVVKALISISSTVNGTPVLDFNRWDDSCRVLSTKFGITNCIYDLIIQVAFMFVLRQFMTQAIDILWPLYSSRSKEILSLTFDLDDLDDDDHMNIPQYVRDSKLAQYSLSDLTDDYSSKVIQFAYMAMFSAAFPLAPVLAYYNNLLEMRVDCWKHLAFYQRAFAYRDSSVGRWTEIMGMIVSVGVVTNALIVAFTSSSFRRLFDSSLTKWPSIREDPVKYNLARLITQLAFVVIFEHAAFVLAKLVDFVVPDIPQSVQLGLEAEEYIERTEAQLREQQLEQEARQAAAEAIKTAQLPLHSVDEEEAEHKEEEEIEERLEDDQKLDYPLRTKSTTTAATTAFAAASRTTAPSTAAGITPVAASHPPSGRVRAAVNAVEAFGSIVKTP